MLLLNGGRLQEMAADRRLPLMMMLLLMREEKEGKERPGAGSGDCIHLRGAEPASAGSVPMRCCACYEKSPPSTKAGWARRMNKGISPAESSVGAVAGCRWLLVPSNDGRRRSCHPRRGQCGEILWSPRHHGTPRLSGRDCTQAHPKLCFSSRAAS